MISVIIPTYNSARFIGNAIKSVRDQTYSDLEIIVVDDGSTDNTEDTVRSISDRRIRYIKTPNQGNYFARNRGLEEAKGNFVAFLDADDVFLPEKLAKQMAQFIWEPSLGLCCSNGYVRFVDKGEQTFMDRSYSFDRDFDTNSGLIAEALEDNFILTSSVMIRRECVKRLGMFDTTFQNAMDYEFFLRIIFHYPACHMGEGLFIRSDHSANISKNKINTYKALLYIFSECIPRFIGGRFYKSGYAALVRRKWHKTMYYLGLTYLKQHSYARACWCFRQCRYPEKRLFKSIAMTAAMLRSPFLVSLISSYRCKKQQEQIVTAKIL
jgi:glycosyltransferase involved in cell wall biosynthesis